MQTSNTTQNVFPKIAILGMGAITLSIARALFLNKVPYFVLTRDAKRKSELLANPLWYRYSSGPKEQISFEGIVSTLEETKDNFDYIILGAKSANLEDSIRKSIPLLSKGGRFVLIQNGLPEEIVSISANQILGGVVGWNTQKLPDGVYFQSNAGALILGGADETTPEPFWKQALEPYITVILSSNLKGFRWHKLGINSVINGLSASCQLTLGELFFKKSGRSAAIRVLTEVRNVMEKIGIKEEVVPGSVSVGKLGDGKGALPFLLRHIILFAIGIKYYRIRTSMVQDLDAGRKTEIDELNGQIVAKSKTLGIGTPVNDAIVKKIKSLEEEKEKPAILFLKELVRL
ncbi:ketopantoate reductase family protein [Leptospira ilyithenensis]|uniref:2-dehydropantoate 2-reductase n=2 Tax=Leptospira ilyithenensis TaxID=2484901 RepID=A0A4R9LPC4_9LEPT|nr:ketopantoate reductase family protein [Leptospira ilyithenensis]